MSNNPTQATPTLAHSEEAEQALLACILKDPNCRAAILDKVRPDDFCNINNKGIYKAILTMYQNGEAIDCVTLSNHIRDEKVKANLRQLMDTAPTTANVEAYANIIVEKASLRQFKALAKELADMTDKSSVTIRKLIETTQAGICAISSREASSGLKHIREAVLNVCDILNERSEGGQLLSGLQTGLPELDRAINGLNDTNLIILAARPNMGKSAMAQAIALDVGKYSGKAVAIFSLEMSADQYATRLISQECLIDGKKLENACLDEDEWGKFAAAVDSLDKSQIYIDGATSVTVAAVKAQCQKVENLGLVIIDYLQLMQSAGGETNRNDNREQVVADISRSLKIMAKELNVPVLCLSQLNRKCEERQDKRPILSDLRESGAIEQDADVVMFLHRDEYYDKDAESSGIMECIIAKNRHGAPGTVKLGWLPECTAVISLEKAEDNGINEQAHPADAV